MAFEQDTIVAIATPAGRGGIGVVRVSGVRARACVAPMLRLRGPLEHARATFTRVVDEEGGVLDEAVVTYFAGPHSYTSEDVVEVSVHGAPVLLDYLLRGAMRHGARLAEPGEFTQRAFLSGRMDLTQAEAVNDLIAAQTLQQAKLAAAQLGGSIARSVGSVKQRLVALIAGLEAGVDFVEDDLDLLSDAAIAERVAGLMEPVGALAKTYEYGRVMREGVRIALVGRPNAGKSSLFNRLLERERAIVTAQAGTTRDPIAERVAIGGIPVELIDTAGLREVAETAESEAEREGITRSRRTMAEADVVLHVVDASGFVGEELSLEDRQMQEELSGRVFLFVLNKCDLVPELIVKGAVRVSALTGDGVDELRAAILESLAARPAGDGALVTNLRQAQALTDCLRALEKALDAARQATPHEFLLLDLYEGLHALDRLTGATSAEDVLRLIFSSFCIGK